MKKEKLAIPREIKGIFFTSIMVYLFIKLLILLPPSIMKYIIDEAIPSANINQVIYLIIIFALLPAIITFIDVAYFRWINGMIWKNALNINLKVFRNILKEPLISFTKKDPGELINLYKSDVTQLYSYYLVEGPKLIANAIVTLILLFYLYSISPVIFMIQLVAIPIIIFPSKKMFNSVKEISKKIFSNNTRRLNIVNESIYKAKLIKVNSLEEFQENKLQEEHRDLIGVWKDVFVYDILTSSWTNSFIGPLVLAISFIYSSHMIINDKMSIGDIVLILSYLPMINAFFSSVAATNLKLAQKNDEYRKVMEMVTRDEENVKKYEIDKIETISAEKIGFKYDEGRELFNNLSFNIKKGNLVCIKGVNGAGKSTLVDLLLGLYGLDKGRIAINGRDLKEVDLKSYYMKTSYVLQDAEILGKTIKESFTLYNKDIKDEEIERILRQVNLGDLALEGKKGIDSEINMKADNFSGGERRKLLLALALSKKSELLILDEITANIDVDTINTIYSTIKDIKNARDTIIILISHDSYLQDLVDAEIVLS